MQEEQIVRVLIAAGLIITLVLLVLPPLAKIVFGAGRDTRPRRR